ncbi:MAG: 16S rRNA (adenine(1518)-N(6)/adenine(1519)-N(6))-dimethyltransferase RsmA [Pseudomonadota bacterium]
MAHRPRKRFGQHFLTDVSVIDKIIALIAPQPSETIIEIGPGEGVLTEHLLASRAKIVAIEIDRDLAQNLTNRFAARRNFNLINEDVLKVELRTLVQSEPVRIVGNLPYNISTPLLQHLFAEISLISQMVFMLQREVVKRMCAASGGGDFGRLSILTQTHCRAINALAIPPTAFSPPPKVDSAIVALTPHSDQLDESLKSALATVTRHAFSQRRKKLKTGLKALFSTAQISAAGIDENIRPDQLSIDAYIALAKQLSAAE